MLGRLLLPLVFAAFLFSAAFAYNFTLPGNAPANFSSSFNATLRYIGTVNQSSYIIFYPNLTGAYSALANAKSEYAANASAAYFYLDEAHERAATELARIYSYRADSLIVMGVLAAASAAALYVVMRAPKVVVKGRRKKGTA